MGLCRVGAGRYMGNQSVVHEPRRLFKKKKKRFCKNLTSGFPCPQLRFLQLTRRFHMVCSHACLLISHARLLVSSPLCSFTYGPCASSLSVQQCRFRVSSGSVPWPLLLRGPLFSQYIAVERPPCWLLAVCCQCILMLTCPQSG